MTISQTIAYLENVKAQYGDIQVKTPDGKLLLAIEVGSN